MSCEGPRRQSDEHDGVPTDTRRLLRQGLSARGVLHGTHLMERPIQAPRHRPHPQGVPQCLQEAVRRAPHLADEREGAHHAQHRGLPLTTLSAALQRGKAGDRIPPQRPAVPAVETADRQGLEEPRRRGDEGGRRELDERHTHLRRECARRGLQPHPRVSRRLRQMGRQARLHRGLRAPSAHELCPLAQVLPPLAAGDGGAGAEPEQGLRQLDGADAHRRAGLFQDTVLQPHPARVDARVLYEGHQNAECRAGGARAGTHVARQHRRVRLQDTPRTGEDQAAADGE